MASKKAAAKERKARNANRFFAGLQELLGPAVIETLGDTLVAAQLGDAVLAAQALQDYTDLLFCRKSPTCRATVSLTTFSAGSLVLPDFCLIFAP